MIRPKGMKPRKKSKENIFEILEKSKDIVDVLPKKRKKKK